MKFSRCFVIDDVAVIEERNVVNDVVAVNETPAADITLILEAINNIIVTSW
jgi:hypothetical protein